MFADEEPLRKFVYEKAETACLFRVSMYAKDEATAKAAAEAAYDRIAVLNSILSDYDSDSELSRFFAHVRAGESGAGEHGLQGESGAGAGVC